MTTETDICNLALDLLKEAPIASMTENRPMARWFSRNYANARDGLLRQHDWNFARARASLAADSGAPAFGWDWAYTQPADCLRIIPLTINGDPEGTPIPHEVEAGKILTDKEAPLLVRYIKRETNCDLFAPEFIDALAARMAMRMAHYVTGKTGYQQIAANAYQEALKSAWLVNAIEGTAPRAADNEWIDAR